MNHRFDPASFAGLLPDAPGPLSDEALVALRRDMHRHPELSHHEARTAALVAASLEAQGLEVRTGVGGHGVIADIHGEEPGPTLLYRADMDALPIQEIAGRDYGSENEGVMHACGHDVHTTMGLGVAAALAERRAEIHGTIRCLFQPAEEAAPPPGQTIGAERMVEEGALEGVDAAFALHVMPTIDVGKIGFTGGPVWAASDLFDVWIRGGMAHGAYPHEGRDPIVAAAQLITAWQTVPARFSDARDPVVLSVGRVEAGRAYNIIPDSVHLQGLLRTHDPAVRAAALEHATRLATQIASAFDCEAEIQFVRGTYQTSNDPVLEARAVQAIAASGAAETIAAKPQMGAEDFAAFSRRVPGCYLFLGVRNEARGIKSMIHTPEFDVDERCLRVGVDAMSAALLELGATWPSGSASFGGS